MERGIKISRGGVRKYDINGALQRRMRTRDVCRFGTYILSTIENCWFLLAARVWIIDRPSEGWISAAESPQRRREKGGEEHLRNRLNIWMNPLPRYETQHVQHCGQTFRASYTWEKLPPIYGQVSNYTFIFHLPKMNVDCFHLVVRNIRICLQM